MGRAVQPGGFVELRRVIPYCHAVLVLCLSDMLMIRNEVIGKQG